MTNTKKTPTASPALYNAAPAEPQDDGMTGQELEAVEESIGEYLAHQSPADRKRLRMRLDAPEFAALTRKHMALLGELLPLCGLADDQAFASTELPFLQPDYSTDEDLLAMSLWVLEPGNRAQVFRALKVFGSDTARAERRAGAIIAKFNNMSIEKD